eukprot:1160927-Pelagomonas_calceolata.AAC.7
MTAQARSGCVHKGTGTCCWRVVLDVFPCAARVRQRWVPPCAWHMAQASEAVGKSHIIAQHGSHTKASVHPYCSQPLGSSGPDAHIALPAGWQRPGAVSQNVAIPMLIVCDVSMSQHVVMKCCANVRPNATTGRAESHADDFRVVLTRARMLAHQMQPPLGSLEQLGMHASMPSYCTKQNRKP